MTPLTIPEWQHLAPAAAAREVHRRAARLSATQQRAVLAHLAAEPALAAAIASAPTGDPLSRVPYFAKDLFDVAGLPTAAGSTFLPSVRPVVRDSTLVSALRSAGAVFAGKTQLHEFAYGITGENPHFGDAEHPRHPGRTTGGSSSGSAAAVAAGLAPFALGTDTGGSIRVPAAFCGLYGYRGAPGDAFIRDAFPLAPTCDTAGWLAATAADLATVTRALVPLAPPPASPPRGCYLTWPDVDTEVSLATAAAAAAFGASADAHTRDTLLAAFADTVAPYNTLVAAEAWMTHAPWAERCVDRYDSAVWARLVRGRALAATELADAHRARARVAATWAAFFADYEFLILPATPCAALTKAECDLAHRRRLLALTTPASLGGQPVITVPVALPSGLTTGLQLVVRDPASPALAWLLQRLVQA